MQYIPSEKKAKSNGTVVDEIGFIVEKKKDAICKIV